MKHLLLLLAFVMLGYSMASAQSRSITGTVFDEDGNTLPGATVRIAGTQTATVTDVDGKFSIQAGANDKALTISFIGMKNKEVPITANMTVTLNYESNLLEEVVSVGYYQKKQGAMTGSVGIIKESALQQPVANITQMLQGSTPGVIAVSNSGKPGAAANIQIRGVGSVNSGTSPLYIVDGVPVGSADFAMLNPGDIDKMNVLKDASAVALYGSRGANGVVVVQTKRGTAGQTVVKYKGEFGTSSLLKGNLDMMNTQEKLAYEIKAGLLNPNTTAGQALIEQRSRYNYNQFDEVFDKPTMQSHEISINGGNDRTKFYISGSYFDQGGIIARSDFRRMTGALNLDHQANSWLKVGTNLFLGQNRDDSPVTPDLTDSYGWNGMNLVNVAVRLNPYEPLKDETGKYVEFLPTYGSPNPLRQNELMDFQTKRYNLRNLTYVEIEPLEGLKWRSSIGFSLNEVRQRQYASPEAYWGSSVNGYAVKDNNLYYKVIQNNQANYSKKIDKHTFTIMAGSEILKEKTETSRIMVKNVRHPYFTEIGQFQEIYDNTNGWGGGYSEHSMASFYGIAGYEFDYKYFIDLSFRTDGDSRLSAGNQWRQFWSVGLQWNLKEESFLKEVELLSSAKIRGSIGTQGNSDISDYIARGSYNFSGSYLGNPASIPGNIGDDELTWEKTTSYNVGLEAGILNNRFRASVDLYKRTTSDMFYEVPVSLTSGFASRLRNAGEMYNKGIEITLGADIVRTRDLYIGIEGNVSLNKNEVTKLYNDVEEIINYGNATILKVGESYGQSYVTRWAGVNPVNGDPLWYDKEGNITNQFSDDDAVILKGKNMLPNKTAGLTLTADYKGFGLHALFTSVWDKWGANTTLRYIELDDGLNGAQYNHTKQSIDFWTKPGDVTRFPRLASGSNQFDTRLIEDQSFLRLKNVTVSYTFNKKWLNALKVLQGARLYVTGQNLLTFTDYRGLDPEVSGIFDRGTYPASRSFIAGVELTF